jgi:hypothetical protein
MKKKILQILVILIFIGAHGCIRNNDKILDDAKSKTKNDNQTGKDSISTPYAQQLDTTDECDYYVDSNEADLMIKKFESDFYTSGLNKKFWIETCVLQALKKFLDSNSRYDGFRFFLGKNKGVLSPKSNLQVVPTVSSNSSDPNEKHTNAFGSVIPILPCVPSQLMVNLPARDAVDKINLFGIKFRKEQMEGLRSSAAFDQLSLGIWMSRCKIDKILSLYTPENNLDGLMAICAAYRQDDTRRERGERKYPVQSTFIFIPTKNGIPDWKVVPPPPPGWNKIAGFNHGSLCPQICN